VKETQHVEASYNSQDTQRDEASHNTEGIHISKASKPIVRFSVRLAHKGIIMEGKEYKLIIICDTPLKKRTITIKGEYNE